MALQDKLKQKIDEATAIPPPDYIEDTITEETCAFDLAGFDPRDEIAFFNAVLILETEGQFGGTEISRAEIMRRFRVRDRNHWHTVRESMYAALIHQHGSMDAVGQRELSWRLGHIATTTHSVAEKFRV